MTIPTQRVIKGLRQQEDIEELHECIRLASDLLPKSQNTHYKSGFDYIDGEIVSLEDAADIAKLLVNLLQSTENPEIMTGVLFALGKYDNRYHKETIIVTLEKCARIIDQYNIVLFQALIALRNLGEDVFEYDSHGNSSQNAFDLEKNLRQAKRYLDQMKAH